MFHFFYLNMDLNSKFIYTWIYKNLLKGALINKVLINKKCDIYWNLGKHEKNRTKINVIINKLTTHHFVSDTKKDHDYNDAPLPTMVPLGYLMPLGYLIETTLQLLCHKGYMYRSYIDA